MSLTSRGSLFQINGPDWANDRSPRVSWVVLARHSEKSAVTKKKKSCLVSDTGRCLRRNAVYQIKCKSCELQLYIGSTTRFKQDRVREHLTSQNYSVKNHIIICQNTDFKGIAIKIITQQNYPANLRLFEAFCVRKCKLSLNSWEECSDFSDLSF